MRRFNSWALAAIATFTLGGCALEFQNAQPYQQVQREAQPPGQIYAGWRVFQDKCASCHGPAALGAGDAPNLLPIVRELGPQLVHDAEITARETRRIGGRQAQSLSGHGRRNGKAVQFTAVLIDLPGPRVAFSVTILESGFDPALLEGINAVYASFRAIQ